MPNTGLTEASTIPQRHEIFGLRSILAIVVGFALISGGCGSESAEVGAISQSVAAGLTPTASIATPGPTSSLIPDSRATASIANATNVERAGSSTPAPGPTSTASPGTPTATSTPRPPVDEPQSVAAGKWAFEYHLTANTCGGSPDVTYLPVTQEFEEVAGADGIISDGEQVRIYDFNGGASLGLLTFHWPMLSYQVPLNEPGGIRTEVTHTFADAHSGSSKVVEVYSQGSGTCELTYAR